MLSRIELEEREKRELAPYALKSCLSKGRVHPESPHLFRPDFQRDKERICYSTAFRRLKYKTQVFVNHEGDHYRTRLTHSLEVALVSRSLCRTLLLNEDVAEAIALAHDLGHSPFGHAGEVVLNKFMREEGGFEHNKQSLRIVELLEDSYESFQGLNLTYEVREGIKKHSPDRFNALEFQVVNLSDDIAYNAHDLDDGLRSGYITKDQVKKLKIWKRLFPEGGKGQNEYQQNRMASRKLVDQQIQDVLYQSEKNIQTLQINSIDDLQGKEDYIISFSPEFKEEIKELRLFLKKYLYSHPKVLKVTEEAQDILKSLLDAYMNDPQKMPPYFCQFIPIYGMKRVITDYVSGMTDRYAYKEADSL